MTLGGILLSSCVASTVDTANFTEATSIGSTEAVLALDSGTLPSPTVRPSEDLLSSATGTTPVTPQQVEVSQANDPLPETPSTSDVAGSSNALADQSNQTVATAPAVPAVPAESTVTGDDANSRIATASNAPTVSSTQSTPAQPAEVAAVAPVVQQPSEPQAALAPASEPRKRTGLFATLFANPDTKKPTPPAKVAASTTQATANRVVATASAEPVNRERAVIATASARGSLSALPGVDRERAVGIPEADQDDSGEFEVASAGGLARLAPNGLSTQHSGVDVKCLKPALVRVLKQVERKYGKTAVVTSGYRSPSHNKKVRGAKKSLHMYCAAADIQVPGVSKWDLASYMRSMPGRGGVGTYCHTNSVHVDIGPRRDWNWRCRRR